jgi:hypothetical protein
MNKEIPGEVREEEIIVNKSENNTRIGISQVIFSNL